MSATWKYQRHTEDAGFQPMALKNKIMKIINRWPMALIVFGLVLTLLWLVLLIMFPLHLLQVL